MDYDERKKRRKKGFRLIVLGIGIIVSGEQWITLTKQRLEASLQSLKVLVPHVQLILGLSSLMSCSQNSFLPNRSR